jgi:uncharacterized protein (DUF2062 family)
MPQRILRRISRQFRQKEPAWYLKPFRVLLNHPMYFAVNRRSVTNALWIGVFISMLPFPGHTPVAVILALLFGCNIAIAALAAWINSPVTMLPVFYFEYRLGTFLMGMPRRPWPDAVSWDWLQSELAAIWKPLFLGAGLTATLTASLAYLVLNALWRWSASRRRRQARAPGPVS